MPSDQRQFHDSVFVKLTVGMRRREVNEILGQPDSAEGGYDLWYRPAHRSWLDSSVVAVGYDCDDKVVEVTWKRRSGFGEGFFVRTAIR